MEQTQIKHLVEQYIDRINHSDGQALATLFARDGVLMAPDVPTMEGNEQIKAFFAHALGAIRLSAKIAFDEIVVMGDYAFARTHSDVEVTNIEENVTQAEQNRELFICKKEDQVWKIARYMFNKLPQVK